MSKQLLISIAVVLVFIAGVYFLLPRGPVQPTISAPEDKIVKEDLSLADTKIYKESTPYVVFDTVYPQFKNTSQEFNDKIKNSTEEGIAQSKTESEANWKARYETRSPTDKITEFPSKDEKFTYDVGWIPIQVNKNFISVLVDTSAYTGGAHGYEVWTSYNYDVAKGREVKLADLFPKDPKYLQTISNFARKDLTAQFREKLNVDVMLIEGTKPTEENFSVFTFTPKKVTIYFNEYQVGPYALGQSKVEITR